MVTSGTSGALADPRSPGDDDRARRTEFGQGGDADRFGVLNGDQGEPVRVQVTDPADLFQFLGCSLPQQR